MSRQRWQQWSRRSDVEVCDLATMLLEVPHAEQLITTGWGRREGLLLVLVKVARSLCAGGDV